MAQRKCGDCTACCTLLGVPEMGKVKNTKCWHECKKGCAIFGKPERPSGCSQFECLWLRGAFGPMDRPDKTGVVFTVTNPDTPIDTPVGKFPQGIVAMEIFDGAASTVKVRKLIDKVNRVPVLVVPPNDKPRKLIVPAKAPPQIEGLEVEADTESAETPAPAVAVETPAPIEPSPEATAFRGQTVQTNM